MIQTTMSDKVFAKGDDWPPIPFAVVLDADGTTPVGIRDWTLEFVLSKNKDYSSPFATLTIGNGITVVSDVGGTFTVAVVALVSALCTITPTALNSSTASTHYWQVHRTNAGLRRLIGFGTIPVRA